MSTNWCRKPKMV